MTPGGSVALTPTVRVSWRRNRTVIGVVVGVLAVTLLLAWAGSGTTRGFLDPNAVDPSGSRALARLLADQGVTITEVRTTTDAAAAIRSGDRTTLFVTTPWLLNDDAAGALRSAGATRVVLMEPSGPSLTVLAPGVAETSPPQTEVASPGCDDPIAARAGPVVLGGASYTAPPDAVTCFRGGGGHQLVRLSGVGDADRRSQTVSVIGSSNPFTNERLADEGNASLATGLLGQEPTLVWFRPSLSDPVLDAGDDGPDLGSLVPGWVRVVVLQLLVAAALLAWARGRRLGPVVTEPLPVVVRAAESVEGRARLYRRAGSRDRAAAVLREATARRLARPLGLPRTTAPADVAVAAATRTGRPAADVVALLAGPAPDTDESLVRLADSLDDLERQVRRP